MQQRQLADLHQCIHDGIIYKNIFDYLDKKLSEAAETTMNNIKKHAVTCFNVIEGDIQTMLAEDPAILQSSLTAKAKMEQEQKFSLQVKMLADEYQTILQELAKISA